MTAPENQSLLKVSNLNFYAGDVQILKNISFEAGKGEFIGIIGPNGAGKTTLLKCLNGLNHSQDGSVFLKGKSVSSMDSKSIAREAALMHQSTDVSFPFTCLEVVMTGRYPYLGRFEREKSSDYALARKYMKFTDTDVFENRPVTQISGGERQRVLFAKLLVQETDLILLDEPTASLDISYEEQIFDFCRKLCEAGKTVIAAVHDIKAASRFCSRLILMKNGEIISDGIASEVLTSESLSEAFGVKALVYRSRISGNLDFYIHGIIDNIKASETTRNVHVIAGGGSASAVFRLLFEKSVNISAGVFMEGDSDLSSAEIFGARSISEKPFSEISQKAFEANVEMIKDAELTILCGMPFGIQNLKNLDAAFYARRLVIIEDSSPEGRDFTAGEAISKYYKLRSTALVVESAKLHEIL